MSASEAEFTPLANSEMALIRKLLAVCDIESNRGMAELRAIVNRAQSADHLITPVLLRREIGRWIRHLD